jgi:ribonuclease P protein component
VALSYKNRITNKKDFDSVFRKGKKIRNDFLFAYYLKNNKNTLRIAFVISTKLVPLAVNRNKIRRKLSEEVLRLGLLNSGYDIIIGVVKKIKKEEIKYLNLKLNDLLLNIIKN